MASRMVDAQFGDDVECGGTEHLILLVAQGLRRRNYDRVAGVYADRVDVLHVTDGETDIYTMLLIMH